jgi:hypothetical protein
MSAPRRSRDPAVRPARRSVGALAYKNRRGDTYYLHEGTTKTDKRRYFVIKTERESALASMLEGFEFAKSVNGGVSMTRRRT